jgi:hypothetical protein
MPHPKVIRRKIAIHNLAEHGDAFSVVEFCERHRISVQLYYKNRHQMPRSFKVGARVLISKESAAEWRRAREQDGQR